MANKKFAVIDNKNHMARCFHSYFAASLFRAMNNKYDWLITSYYPANSYQKKRKFKIR